MPIGRPDWSAAGQSANTSTLLDMAELAVRLGSPVGYDRTGKAIWYDTFTRLDSQWITTGSGISSGPAVDTNYADSGGSSVKTALNIGLASRVQFSRISRAWNSAKISVEMGCMCLLDVGKFWSLIRYNDSGIQNSFGVQYDPATKELGTYVSFNNYNTFATLDYDPLEWTYFTTCKLDVDLATGKYIRFRLDSEVWDLSNVNIVTGANAIWNILSTTIAFYGHDTNAVEWYLDRVIVTEDE